MSLKKQLERERRFTTLLALVCVGGMFMVVLAIILIEPRPEFTIYKEECINGTITEDIALPLHLFSYFDRENPPSEQKLINACHELNGTISKDERFSFTLYCSIKDFTHEKQICNNIETSHIEYQSIDYKKLGDCSKSVNGTNLTMVLTFEEDSDIKRVDVGDVNIYTEDCIDSEVYPTKKVHKDDLTIEWLNKKGECIKSKDQLLEDVGWKNCIKYKFKEYTIETK